MKLLNTFPFVVEIEPHDDQESVHDFFKEHGGGVDECPRGHGMIITIASHSPTGWRTCYVQGPPRVATHPDGTAYIVRPRLLQPLPVGKPIACQECLELYIQDHVIDLYIHETTVMHG